MMKQHLFTLFFCLLCLAGFPQSIDPQKSIIKFEVSNMGVNTVEGRFTGITGTVYFNPQQLTASRMQAAIDVASVDTGIEKRDNHLRSEDFFYVEKYPRAMFTSTNIEVRGSGYVATGVLLVRGMAREVTIPFTVSGDGDRMVLHGQLTLNRKDFNIGDKFGSFMVGRKVNLQIICVVN
ncbi:YceI family protein [Pontibacter anaerobius]|uniref:YceI family protein n=1 Tax=Pontibacter anaerobius TaxID=2993940 RepID=A0ABT3RKG9_9BACT|nr:YceI family protein [Pontibacter anaerobius]MCX2742189.1 YceI family protein [Pontibacter anaerobius]